MKSLKNRINESLYPDQFEDYKENDYITREYNNLFGMFTNTLMRKVSDDCYAITGSALHEYGMNQHNEDTWMADFLFSINIPEDQGRDLEDWLNKIGFKLKEGEEYIALQMNKLKDCDYILLGL